MAILGHEAGLDGMGIQGCLLECRSDKIPHSCRSSFRAELEALQATADLVEATAFQMNDLVYGTDPAEWL